MHKLFLILFSLFLINLVFADITAGVDISDFFSPRLPPDIKCIDFFSCLAIFFIRVLQVILFFSFALAVIFISYAGISYIVEGSGKDIAHIHKMIIWAVIGFIVAIASFTFINLLEFWVTSDISFLNKFIFAQTLNIPDPPSQLRCGAPSVLESVNNNQNLDRNIWINCTFYYIARALSFLYILALALGVIFLSLAGISYITHPEKSKDVHNKLIWGIVGVILAILSFAIVQIIETFFIEL
jgi:uncharacterized membrane protein YjfL (UPF0719 family)